MVGKVGIGGSNPIRVQSMLTSDTRDAEACVQEALGLVAVGCEIVRVTAQTRQIAENLEHIRAGLLAVGCDVPLVADIHFKPDAAMEAVKWVEKVRVNPGNYVDKKKFAVLEYTDEAYAEELLRIEEQFTPLVLECKRLGRAMRIGTNHGSLSDRIMNRYGDTPLGMVESALEFARIARRNDYHNFLFSMKASNPKVMIEAYRLLVAHLEAQGADWNYPIHLGVTEAGDGEDGRIKSAIGIGSLLADGIGDTVRVSLTEDAVFEIPVCYALVKPYNEGVPGKAARVEVADAAHFHPNVVNPTRLLREKATLSSHRVWMLWVRWLAYPNTASFLLAQQGKESRMTCYPRILGQTKIDDTLFGNLERFGHARRLSNPLNANVMSAPVVALAYHCIRIDQQIRCNGDRFSRPIFRLGKLIPNMSAQRFERFRHVHSRQK